MTHSICKSVLDNLAAWLDRREVNALRKRIVECETLIVTLQKTVDEKISQIANANGRVSRTTNANLALKKLCRENGIDVDGMAA